MMNVSWGFWLGQDFWGQGIMPEAAGELLRHGFEDLGMNVIWCGYYDGNAKSKRTQEKIGFIYHHTCDNVPVPLMHEVRTCHTNYMTKERWIEISGR
jgi:ribosomal-protein-alanine N-acetyltransferase